MPWCHHGFWRSPIMGWIHRFWTQKRRIASRTSNIMQKGSIFYSPNWRALRRMRGTILGLCGASIALSGCQTLLDTDSLTAKSKRDTFTSNQDTRVTARSDASIRDATKPDPVISDLLVRDLTMADVATTDSTSSLDKHVSPKNDSHRDVN